MRLFGYIRKQCDTSGLFYRQSQSPLVFGAGAGNASGKNLSPFGDEPAQCIRFFVIDFQFLGAEFADFLLEKNLTAFCAATA
jgi:hypothetical protein